MRKLFTFFLTILFHHSSIASHIIGGEVNYKNLGNNLYEIKLIVYRDCGSTVYFDDPARIGIYESTTLVTLINSPLDSVSQVEPPPLPPCVQIPPDVCVQRGVYVDTVQLFNTKIGFDIVYSRCCRNGSIVNITSPGQTGSTFSAFIPPNISLINDNPVYNEFPPIFLCVNTPFTFDHGATDADGDSLVYNLCTPSVGGTSFNPQPNPPPPPPFANVNWAGTYDANSPLQSISGFNLNTQTGLITTTPSALGQYVVGVCVSEYRNGVFLSETKREFQFNIIDCQNSVATIDLPANNCLGLTIDFSGSGSNATNYFWDFGDLSTTEDTSSLQFPTYTYPDTGTYEVSLFVFDDFAQCGDTITVPFTVLPLLQPSIVEVLSQCLNTNFYNFQLSGAFDPNVATYTWILGNGASPATSNAQTPQGVTYNSAGIKSVAVVVEQYGCNATQLTEFEIYPVSEASFSDNSSLCGGLSPTFTYTGQGNISSYSWSFGDSSSSSDTSSLQNPTYTFPQTGSYPISLIVENEFGCRDTANANINVTEYIPFTATSTQGKTVRCVGDTVVMNIYAQGGLFNVVRWSVNGSPFTSNPFFSFTINDTLQVIYTARDTCNISVSDTIQFNIPKYDLLSATASNDSTVCPKRRIPLSVSFNGGSGFVNYDWSTLSGNDLVVNNNSDTTSIFPTSSNQLIVTVRDVCNFVAVDTVWAKIKTCDVEVPNIFTPNNDAVNNKFIIKGIEEYKGNNVVIFDRWGRKVAEINEYNSENAWDGSGSDTGTYYYIVTFTDQSLEPLKGFVHLMK